MRGHQFRHQETEHPNQEAEHPEQEQGNQTGFSDVLRNRGAYGGHTHQEQVRTSAFFDDSSPVEGRRESMPFGNEGTAPQYNWPAYRETASPEATNYWEGRAQQYYQTGGFGYAGGEQLSQYAPPPSSRTDKRVSAFFETSSIDEEQSASSWQASGIGETPAQTGRRGAVYVDAYPGRQRSEVSEGRRSSRQPSDFSRSLYQSRETDPSELYSQLSYQGKELANVIRSLDARQIDRSTVLPDRSTSVGRSTSDLYVNISLDTSQVRAAQENIRKYVRASYTLTRDDVALIRQMYPDRSSQVVSEAASERRQSDTSMYKKLDTWGFGDTPVRGEHTQAPGKGDNYISAYDNRFTSPDARKLASILEFLHKIKREDASSLVGRDYDAGGGNVKVTLISERERDPRTGQELPTARAHLQQHFANNFKDFYIMSGQERRDLDTYLLGRRSAVENTNVKDWKPEW